MNFSDHNSALAMTEAAVAYADLWPDWPIRNKIRLKDYDYELINHLQNGSQISSKHDMSTVKAGETL